MPTEVSSRPTSAAGWSPTTRTTRPRRQDAFDVLHFIAAQAPGGGPADRDRRHQRAARGAQAAGRSWPASTTACRWRSSSTCPERLCHERNAAAHRPRLRPARHPRSRPQQLHRSLRGLEREGFRHVYRAQDGRGRRRAPSSSASRSGTTEARARAVRHHRRRARLLRRAGRAAGEARLHRSSPAQTRRRSGRLHRAAGPVPPAASRSSSATSSTAARGRRTCCAW